MSKLDQFASAFKSASKAVFRYESVPIHKVILFTDLDAEQSRRFMGDCKRFLSVLETDDDVGWDHFYGERYEDVGDLLELVERERPDLICAYRNIHGRARHFPFSLGAHVDVLTQATSTPVLLLPQPTDEGRLSPACTDTSEVMVMTDHLTGADNIINHGVRFTDHEGTLVLTHLEDDAIFERYIDIISKIPAIDTDVARERIRERLLREPGDYIADVEKVIAQRRPRLKLEKEVSMGHRVSDCKALIERHDIDMVVINTKDEDQLAMHGLAYPLAIELRGVPLLML